MRTERDRMHLIASPSHCEFVSSGHVAGRDDCGGDEHAGVAIGAEDRKAAGGIVRVEPAQKGQPPTASAVATAPPGNADGS